MKDEISKELLSNMTLFQMEWCLETVMNNDVSGDIISNNKTVNLYFTMLIKYNLIYLSESTDRFLLTNYGEKILYWIKANLDS